MKMKTFLWVIDAQLFDYIKSSGGVSSSYLLPFSHTKPTQAKEFPGSYIWLILRKSGHDSLFANIFINQVDQFVDGLNKNDYLLTIDNSISFRIISDLSSFQRWQIDETSNTYPYGVSEIKLEINAEINRFLLTKISFNFKRPLDSFLSNLKMPSLFGSHQSQSKTALKCILSNVALNDIWAGKVPQSLSPFANFAYYKIEFDCGKSKAIELLSFLQNNDPLSAIHIDSALETNISVGSNHNKASNIIPEIDIDFSPINPAQIFARKFIGNTASSIDYDRIMQKTGIAEKKHQDILRDFATFLISLGFTPKQSNSIDLALTDNAAITFFEIKTISESNALQQVSKGLFQLLCYKDKLINSGLPVKHTVLILTKLIDDSIEIYITNLLAPLGIVVLFYDVKLHWPNKLSGLKSIGIV